jgi:hypothetical protein
MADADKLPIQVDQAMARIRERIHMQREALKRQPSEEVAGPKEQALSIARKHAQVGVSLPPMHHQSGFQRMLAMPVAKLFLRFAQLVTRDQRSFNQAIIDASSALDEQLRDLGRKLDSVVARVESLEAGAAQPEQESAIATQLAQFRDEREALALQLADLRAERKRAGADQSAR